MNTNLHIIEHPLVQHKLSLLRDQNTEPKAFRELVTETAILMTYEATRDLPLKQVQIQTPIAIANTKVISGKKLAFVPILRAGIGMMDGALSLVPAAKVGHIGAYRDPETHESVQYYCKLPVDIALCDVIVADPMLATGHTAILAIDLLKKNGVKSIKFMCIIASTTGVDALMDAHPDVEIYCAAVDKELNDDLYVVPGLGDVGDRIFGTR